MRFASIVTCIFELLVLLFDIYLFCIAAAE